MAEAKIIQPPALAPGATASDLLAGSSNPTDVATIQQSSSKPLSAPALAQKTSAESGLSSLATIKGLLDQGISSADIAASHLPFGATVRPGASRGKRGYVPSITDPAG